MCADALPATAAGPKVGRMTSTVVADAHEAPAAAPRACFHCGLPVPSHSPWETPVGGVPRAFCCAGCLAISQTIDAAGLATYYRQRTLEGGAAALPAAGDDWLGSDEDALRARFARRTGDGLEAALLVEGLTCGACVWLIESWLVRQPGVTNASVNFATRRARVRWREGEASLSALLAAVRAIGFAAHPYDPARREALAKR